MDEEIIFPIKVVCYLVSEDKRMENECVDFIIVSNTYELHEAEGYFNYQYPGSHIERRPID